MIPVGTRIRQISGPTVINEDVTLDKNVESYYPFSTDYTKEKYVRIKNGLYSFEITNPCGDPSFTKSFDHWNYSIRDPLNGVTYTTQESCYGLQVFPTIQFYQNDYPQGAYYKMITAPDDVDINNGTYQFHSSETDPVNKTGKYFLLPISGRYVFQISYHYSSCPATDYVIIDYEPKNFEVERPSVYTCTSGGTPRFYINAKNGVAPYTYELMENGVVVAVNNTGEFVYGHPSNSYSAKISDACGINLPVDLQVLDFTTDAIISGTDKVCPGGTISLSCLSLGATNFQWTGPAGFSATTQNISIPNITDTKTGVYTVSVQPYGCSHLVTQPFEVNIYIPPAPLAPDTIMFCVNGDNTLPLIEPLPDHSLVWYTGNGITECPPPEINTSNVHTEIYYVAQKHNDLDCTGDKKKIVFKVNLLPLPAIDVNAPDVCMGYSPVIGILNSIQDYTYSIYTDNMKTDKIAEINGIGGPIWDTLDMTVNQNTAYYIYVTDNNGCVSQSSLTVDVGVIELYILPEYLPPYQENIRYEYNLTTNAKFPDFSITEGELPSGLTLYSTGLISGTPNSISNDALLLSIQVKDVNGCTALREYTFESVTLTPKVFTPNNDGINDVFMPGKRVVIFDRLGIVMFEGDNGWDGTYKGKPVPTDIYFYKLMYKENNVPKIKTGYIGIIRDN
jgi:gliding motility-associated-like protein